MTNDLTAAQTAALRYLDGTSKMLGNFRTAEGEGLSGSALRALIRKGLVATSTDWANLYTGTSYALTVKGAQVLRALDPVEFDPAPEAPAGHAASVIAKVQAMNLAPAPADRPLLAGDIAVDADGWTWHVLSVDAKSGYARVESVATKMVFTAPTSLLRLVPGLRSR